jgi:hypothetical protein
LTSYNVWYAVTHELLLEAINIWPKLKYNKWITYALSWTKEDWVLWKTEKTMQNVDQQAEELVKSWEKEEAPNYEYVEHEPDGSKAQDLLGGAMEIKSTWRRD